MAHFEPKETVFSTLRDKVVVIAGGATGIGAATVKLLAQHQAYVYIGDINDSAANKLCSAFLTVVYQYCDVTKDSDIYSLFHEAFERHGHIDHAISCAGIFEQGNWFDPNLTISGVKDVPGNTKTLDVNLKGTLHFARIGAAFLRQSGADNKSLTLLSSVNAFRDSPGLYLYQTSKHAIQGILRSSRKTLYERDGIRVNAVCPGVTDTPMSAHIVPMFRDAGVFWQPAEVVARIIAGVVTGTGQIVGNLVERLNGKAFYVEGGDAWEFEDSLYDTQAQWLGEEPTRRMRVNTEAVQKGALVPK